MEKPMILVIDDDAAILEVISLILTEAGYPVRTGTDVTALYEIEKQPPGLLLIDNWLSGKTGHDICWQLKNNPATAAIPVILISATANLEDTAQRCGADAYISKPFEMDDLLAQVGKHARHF